MSVDFQYGGNDPSLIQYLEERVRSDPASSFFAMLAYHYLEVGRTEEALSLARNGVEAHPGYSTGHAVLAAALMRSGLFSDAKKELATASHLRPDSNLIGSYQRLLDEEGQRAELEKSDTRAEIPEIKPGDNVTEMAAESPGQETIQTRGEVGPLPTPDKTESEEEGDWTDAVDLGNSMDFDAIARELDSAGPIKPASDIPRENSDGGGIELTRDIVTDTLAEILEQQGRLRDAIEAYEMLIEKKPGNAKAYREKISELSSRVNDQH